MIHTYLVGQIPMNQKARSPIIIRSTVLTYVRTYVRMYVRTYVRTYARLIDILFCARTYSLFLCALRTYVHRFCVLRLDAAPHTWPKGFGSRLRTQGLLVRKPSEFARVSDLAPRPREARGSRIRRAQRAPLRGAWLGFGPCVWRLRPKSLPLD